MSIFAADTVCPPFFQHRRGGVQAARPHDPKKEIQLDSLLLRLVFAQLIVVEQNNSLLKAENRTRIQ